MPKNPFSTRPASAVALICAALASGGLAASAASAAPAPSSSGAAVLLAASHAAKVATVARHARSRKGVKVTVKVLGKPPKHKVLLKRSVLLSAKKVARFGGSCSGLSAAGALQLASKGHWSGTWNAEYSDYEVTQIAGLNLPFKSKAPANWYWSFLIGGKVASAGVCEVTPKRGQTVLFEPACYGKACPAPPKAKGSRDSDAQAEARRRH